MTGLTETLGAPATWAGRTTLTLSARDDLPRGAQRAIVIAVVAAHMAGLYGLFQIGAVRDAVREAVPIFAGLIEPSAPPPPPSPPPVIRKAPPPVIAAPPSPTPAPVEFVVPPPPPEAITAPEAPPAPPAPSAPPAPQPRTVSATDVGYLEPPRVTYPSLSRRLGEQGRVTLRVLVDPQGRPAQVLVMTSSGHPRLDDAATAATRAARFRPYTQDGRPETVWVLLPIVFSLEESR
jgi:protein TonB